MKATDSDSGIKEASAASDVKGQMESTPRPWIVIHEQPFGRKIEGVDSSEIYATEGETWVAHVAGDTESQRIANAKLICRAVNNFDALVEALKQARYQLLFSLPTPNSLPRYERRAWMDKIAALIASVEDGSSVPSGNDSSSASSSPKSTSAAVTPTKGAN